MLRPYMLPATCYVFIVQSPIQKQYGDRFTKFLFSFFQLFCVVEKEIAVAPSFSQAHSFFFLTPVHAALLVAELLMLLFGFLTDRAVVQLLLMFSSNLICN